jgi:hypothetical protein
MEMVTGELPSATAAAETVKDELAALGVEKLTGGGKGEMRMMSPEGASTVFD